MRKSPPPSSVPARSRARASPCSSTCGWTRPISARARSRCSLRARGAPPCVRLLPQQAIDLGEVPGRVDLFAERLAGRRLEDPAHGLQAAGDPRLLDARGVQRALQSLELVVQLAKHRVAAAR